MVPLRGENVKYRYCIWLFFDFSGMLVDMSSYKPLRWGILGAGNIARRWSNDVVKLNDQKIQAVGSRDLEKANTFADKYEIPNRHNSYEALVADPEVDAIYVATPHNFHKEHVLLALNAGKHVLCEKPFTVNAKEAAVLIAAAKEKKLLLMEGMWSQVFPILLKAKELIASGAIGKPRQIIADFGYGAGKVKDDGRLEITNPGSRLFDINLIGGGLMDVGVYPVHLATFFFGNPVAVSALGILGDSGVDENMGMLLKFANGEIGITTTSIQVTTPFEAVILGTGGKIEIHSPWWKAQSMTLHVSGQAPEKIEMTHEGEGFQFEAMHFADTLRSGKTESDVLTHDRTLAVMQSLDTMRGQIGLKYPGE
jgi:predicted dehydrogenase